MTETSKKKCRFGAMFFFSFRMSRLGTSPGRQNQRLTRVLPSELTIRDVKTNVLRVFYHQNLAYEKSKLTFFACFTIRTKNLNSGLGVPQMTPYTPGAKIKSQTQLKMQSRRLFLTLLDFRFPVSYVTWSPFGAQPSLQYTFFYGFARVLSSELII